MAVEDTSDRSDANVKPEGCDTQGEILSAILAFDQQRLNTLADQLPRGSVNAELARGWRDLFGLVDLEELAERGRQLSVVAAAEGLAGQVLGSQALCAMAYLGQNDLVQATSTARRASRMAAVEAIPSWGRLVNVVLARVRRHAGRPHLALWICTVIARNMPKEFETWVQWELLLSGHIAAGTSFERWTEPARTLTRLLAWLRDDQSREMAPDADELLRKASVWVGFREETESLLALIHADHTHTHHAHPWSYGVGRAPPYGLAGLCRQYPTAADSATTAYVRAVPRSQGRRILTLGLALCTANERTRVLAEERGHVRTDTGLSVLALAGPAGLDLGTFFRSVYGFTYEAGLHRAVLDTLVHRMRRRVPNDATILRNNEVFSLDCEQNFLIPDPRCSFETTDVVLMALAKGSAVSANDLAAALLIPLRSVQAALAQLADDGACDTARDGRRILYQISDTTFTASTTARS